MTEPATTKKSPLSKAEILDAVARLVGEEASSKLVKLVIEALATVGQQELKKSGIFVLPGFAKFVGCTSSLPPRSAPLTIRVV